MEIRPITNTDLRVDDIPSASVGSEVLDYFALSFDGYAIWGQDRCGRMANWWRNYWEATGELPDTLTEVRGCLFFEQRRRHFVEDYDEQQVEYESVLFRRLRDALEQGVSDDEQATVEAWINDHPDPGEWDREGVRTILNEAVKQATEAIPDAIAARDGTYGLEKDLRDGIVDVLRSQDELVLTEARIGVPEWDARLGGFDLSLLNHQGELALAETKWADGNLWECIWDMLKLASARTMDRICAGFAIYGAPQKHWEKPVPCAGLFAHDSYRTQDVIAAHPHKWKKLLEGSSAWPANAQRDFAVDPIGSFDTTIGSTPWQVRLVEVLPGEAWTWLENGWPSEVQPPS